MDELIEVVARLRGPGGCPWDQKQTHESLVPYLLEEAWEVIDEVRAGKIGAELQDELGDLLLQVVLHARVAEEEGRFTIDEVTSGIAVKMVQRHPHVFGEDHGKFSEAELKERWHQGKKAEKARESVMDDISETVPALLSAVKVGQRAASLRFDWESPENVLPKIEEELQEAKMALASGNSDELEEEIGDLLFAVTNLARKSAINPEIALRRANEKFKQRFRLVEKEILAAQERGEKPTMDAMEQFWQNAKNKL